MFRKINLTTVPDGALVRTVTVPAFALAPDVFLWGTRVFSRLGERGPLVEGDEYREVFAVAIVPLPGVDANGFETEGRADGR